MANGRRQSASAEPKPELRPGQRFRLMAESIEDGVAIIENGRLTLVNDRLCEILGYARHELARMRDLDLAAPEERERLRQRAQWKPSATPGAVPGAPGAEAQPASLATVEFWVVRKDGSRRYVRSQYDSGPDGEGDPRAFVVTADITDQKMPLRAPTERADGVPSASALRQIIDASPDPVVVKDRQGRYVLVNRSYADAFGRQPEDFVGKDELDLGWPEELVRGNPEKGIRGIWADEREIMESGQAKSVPHDWVWLGDRRRQFATTKMPLRDADGNVWGLMGFAREVTAQGRLLAQTEVLREVSQALAAAGDPESMLHAAATPALRTGANVAVLQYVSADAHGRPEWTEVVAAIGEAAPAVGARYYLPDLPHAASFFPHLAQPLMIADLTAAHLAEQENVIASTAKQWADVLQLSHAHALAVLPLRVGQRWEGVITLAWPEPHEFGQEEEQLYDLIGSQLVARVQAQRLHEKADLRAMWSQTAAEVSQAAATILDLDELLHRVVNLIYDRCGLYYAGLYLTGIVHDLHVGQNAVRMGKPVLRADPAWAVLTIGTGEAGKQMVEQGHKLEIGGASMIGQCLATKQPRIALDVGKEPAPLANPLLPEARTELALPLLSRGQALGALTVQSAQPAAFSEEDIAMLQTMADQLAIAIDNARLIGQAQARAEREQRVRAISERIRRGADTETILRITVEEMSRMLGASKAIIRLGTQAQLSAGPGAADTSSAIPDQG